MGHGSPIRIGFVAFQSVTNQRQRPDDRSCLLGTPSSPPGPLGKGTNAVFKRIFATLLLVAMFSASVPGSAFAEDRLLFRKCLPTEVDGEPDLPSVTLARRVTDVAPDPIDSRSSRSGHAPAVLSWPDMRVRVAKFLAGRMSWVLR
jgi:hypothetical protein